jgi:hypothetical protein
MFCVSDILQNVSPYHIAYFKSKKCDAVMFCISDILQNILPYHVAYFKSKKCEAVMFCVSDYTKLFALTHYVCYILEELSPEHFSYFVFYKNCQHTT